MKEVKERVSDLEAILGSFIVQTEKVIIELKTDMIEFKDEMREFKDEMKDFKDEMKEFKVEMQEFKVEMKEFKDDSIKTRKKMSMDIGHLSNRLGTLAEDIAAPGLAGIMKDHFRADANKSAAELIIRNTTDKNDIKEFDAIAVTDTHFFICEIKSHARQDHIENFISLTKTDKIYEFFPEYKDLKLVPVFASLSLPDHMVTNLTKNKILAMAMGEMHMDLLNPEVVEGYM